MTLALMTLALMTLALMTLGLTATRVNAQTDSASVGSIPAARSALALRAPDEGCIRIATFNVSLHRNKAGELVEELEKPPKKQVRRLVEIIRLVSPDILLCNEVDYDDDELSASRLMRLINEGEGVSLRRDNVRPLFQNLFTAPVNTGVDSGLDLNRDGKTGGPNDAWGFGQYPGQYGMVVMSRLPIAVGNVRSFQNFRWSEMPGAMRPMMSDDGPYYDDATWTQLRLSSKSHWDVPVEFDGQLLHVLASHPTPPVFDGPEDRNGKRNHDEIRLFADYAAGGQTADYLRDDLGQRGGLGTTDAFVVLGDLNADPNDGGGVAGGIQKLLEHPRVGSSPIPKSDGAVAAAVDQGGANKKHKGPSAEDTADFNDRSSGNLRCDFVIPSNALEIVATGVFWPTEDDLKAVDAGLLSASDHRLVWMDIRWKSKTAASAANSENGATDK
jgi:hypothetical protein